MRRLLFVIIVALIWATSMASAPTVYDTTIYFNPKMQERL